MASLMRLRSLGLQTAICTMQTWSGSVGKRLLRPLCCNGYSLRCAGSESLNLLGERG